MRLPYFAASIGGPDYRCVQLEGRRFFCWRGTVRRGLLRGLPASAVVSAFGGDSVGSVCVRVVVRSGIIAVLSLGRSVPAGSWAGGWPVDS
jgi:hypothetical protein